MKLDLDAFQPLPDTIRFRGVEYAIPSDVPLTMIMEAAQYEERLRSVEAELRAAFAAEDLDKVAEIGEQQKSVLEGMYALCMKLLKLENPDVPELDLTATDCGRMLAMMASGGLNENIDEAVVAAIAGPKDERRPPPSRSRKTPASSGAPRKRSPGRSSG